MNGGDPVGGRRAVLEQVFIEPTVRCNLRCPLCFTGRGDVPRMADMTMDGFTRAISELPADCRELSLYNFGETLLHRDVIDMIRAAVGKGLSVSLATNFNVPSRIVQEVVGSGLHELIVSLDGVTSASYAAYRVGGRFERVVFNVRTFVAERARLGLRTPRLVLQPVGCRENHDWPCTGWIFIHRGAEINRHDRWGEGRTPTSHPCLPHFKNTGTASPGAQESMVSLTQQARRLG